MERFITISDSDFKFEVLFFYFQNNIDWEEDLDRRDVLHI